MLLVCSNGNYNNSVRVISLGESSPYTHEMVQNKAKGLGIMPTKATKDFLRTTFSLGSITSRPDQRESSLNRAFFLQPKKLAFPRTITARGRFQSPVLHLTDDNEDDSDDDDDDGDRISCGHIYTLYKY